MCPTNIENKNKPLFKYVTAMKTAVGNYELGSPEDIVSHVKRSEVGYEHIDGPCVPYIDFDAKYDSESDQEASVETDMIRWHAAVEAHFTGPNRGNVKLLWFESHGFDRRSGKFKNSAHCIVRGAGYYECGLDVFNSFPRELQVVSDHTVYKEAGKRQLMRLPYARKELDVDRFLKRVYTDADGEVSIVEDIDDLQDEVKEPYSDYIVSNIEGEVKNPKPQRPKPKKLIPNGRIPRESARKVGKVRKATGTSQKRAVKRQSAIRSHSKGKTGDDKRFESINVREVENLLRVIGETKDNPGGDATGWS
jgi:hypothetical protein